MTEKAYRKPSLVRRALGRNVLAVAKSGTVGDWAAYIDAVPGQNHHAEAPGVVETGDKLPKEFACFLFPGFDPATYRE